MGETNTIIIHVNERTLCVPSGRTLGQIKESLKPDADLLVLNGFPGKPEEKLKEGDRLVFIKRGEIPGPDELECLMVARHTPGVHERMKKARVGIAGLGGLGSAVAIALGRMGIGSLILADFDVVEPSNLNRQHYSIEHIGMAKTAAMELILKGINPYIQITTCKTVLDRKNIPEVFGDTQIVVECFDRAESKAMIAQVISEFLPHLYLIGASGLAGFGDSNSIKTRKIGDRIYMVGDLVKAAEPGRGLMAPRVGIAAHHQANLVVNLLMNSEKMEL